MIKSPKSMLFSKGRQGFFGIGVTNQFDKSDVPFCQYWAAAACLTCPHPRHYGELYQNLKACVNAQAEAYNYGHVANRPSRRAANDSRWQTSQNLQLVMLAHYIGDKARRQQLEHIMYTEAGWAMGRNPGNIVEMTGLGERHITDVYTTGRNDGTPPKVTLVRLRSTALRHGRPVIMAAMPAFCSTRCIHRGLMAAGHVRSHTSTSATSG